MLYHKAFSYRIYPTKEQENLLRKTFGSCRFVFNRFLAEWNQAFTETNKGLSYNTCATQLPALKQEFEWLKEVDSIALQSAIRNLADGFDRFFKRQNADPRFKCRKNPVQSFTLSIPTETSLLKVTFSSFRSLDVFVLQIQDH